MIGQWKTQGVDAADMDAARIEAVRQGNQARAMLESKIVGANAAQRAAYRRAVKRGDWGDAKAWAEATIANPPSDCNELQLAFWKARLDKAVANLEGAPGEEVVEAIRDTALETDAVESPAAARIERELCLDDGELEELYPGYATADECREGLREELDELRRAGG